MLKQKIKKKEIQKKRLTYHRKKHVAFIWCCLRQDDFYGSLFEIMLRVEVVSSVQKKSTKNFKISQKKNTCFTEKKRRSQFGRLNFRILFVSFLVISASVFLNIKKKTYVSEKKLFSFYLVLSLVT